MDNLLLFIIKSCHLSLQSDFGDGRVGHGDGTGQIGGIGISPVFVCVHDIQPSEVEGFHDGIPSEAGGEDFVLRVHGEDFSR